MLVLFNGCGGRPLAISPDDVYKAFETEKGHTEIYIRGDGVPLVVKHPLRDVVKLINDGGNASAK